MGPSPTYHPPEGEECETSVEHGLPLWAEPAVGYCSRRPRPSPMWGSRFVGARAVGPWVGEQKPLGKSPLRGNPSPESTYLPTSNTTHALPSPDPQTLPIGEGVPPSHRRDPRNQVAPRPTDIRFLCSLNGRSQLPSEPEIGPRHYPLGVGR